MAWATAVTALLAAAAAAAAAASPGNLTLWESLVGRCGGGPSYGCVEAGLTSYLEDSLSSRELNLGGLLFTENGNGYRAERGPPPEAEPRLGALVALLDGAPPPGSRPPGSVLGAGAALESRALEYLVNHDLRVALPGGAALDLRPQSLEEDGSALVRIKITRPQPQEGRIFKKIRQLFKRRLLTGFLAALLIVALLKVKLLFFAPVLLGVSTAKKILLKVLLFLFPALAHLFKLCAYYHHHHAKLHLHHHHQVAHHHHHVPPSYHQGEVVYPEEGPYPGPHPGHLPGPLHRAEPPEDELSAWGIEAPPEHRPPHLQDRPPSGDIARIYNSIPVKTKKPQVEEWDPFYSPILAAMEDVFNSLGFEQEGCRERLICSMYKAPARFSPHSNLISNQLSREPSELAYWRGAAGGRFHRYMEAARGGQAGGDCLALHPSCSVITE